MPVKVDNAIDEAVGLAKGIDNHPDVISARSDGKQKMDKLHADTADLVNKNSAQKAAQMTAEQKTKEQDDLMKDAERAVTQIQNAAKSAFPGKEVTLKEFKVGMNKPNSVKAMIALLAYLAGGVQKYSEDLLANGLTQDDITNLSNLYAILVGAEAAQENAKKLRNAATAIRDAAAAKLRETVSATRSYLKAVFKDDPAALEEFKSIVKARGKATPKPPAPAPQA